MDIRVLTQLDYANKGLQVTAADLALLPLRKLIGGKRIECVKLNPEDKSCKSYLFRGPNHLRKKHFLRVVIEKIAYLALTILSSPLLLPALFVKEFLTRRDKALFARFKASEIVADNNFDKFEERDILEDSNYAKFVGGMAKQIDYQDIKQHAHLHADKFMGPISPKSLCEHFEQFPGQVLSNYQGGLFFITAKNIKKYIDGQLKITPEDADLKEAKKLIDEYLKWSLRMLPLMLPRLIKSHPKSYVRDMALDLKKRINSLEVGEKFLVPVNIQMKTGGFHTITVEISRESQSKQGQKMYAFRVYNVGAGAGHHPMIRRGFSDYGSLLSGVYPYSVQNISLQDVTSTSFLEGLVDQATFRKKSNNAADEFYEFLGKEFDVKKGHVINKDSDAEEKKLQQSGTCIFKSPMAALKGTMSTNGYKRMMFNIKLNDWYQLYSKYIEPKQPEKSKDGNLLAHIAFHNLEKNIIKQAKREMVNVETVKSKYFANEQLSAFSAMQKMHTGSGK